MEQLLSDEFLAGLPEDDLLAFVYMTEHAVRQINGFDNGPHTPEMAARLIECYLMLQEFGQTVGVGLATHDYASMTHDKVIPHMLVGIRGAWSAAKAKSDSEVAKGATGAGRERAQRFLERRKGQAIEYEFDDKSYARCQELINELRREVVESPIFDEKHRRRLLQRLEKFQSELHKKVSDLDTALGVLVEMGHAVGNAGEAAKPMMDRLVELRNLVLTTLGMWNSPALPDAVQQLNLPGVSGDL